MLKLKGLQTVCLSCRLSLAISQARNARLPSQAQRVPQKFRSTATNVLTQRRAISTTTVRKQVEQERISTPEELTPSPTEQVNIEVNVRRARQQFGDALPRGHLSDVEYKVYERLYGEPVFVDTAEELQEVDAEAEEIIEEEQPDGSVVLLRRGADGELEEIELSDEEVDPLEEDEDAELDETTMTAEEWEAVKEEKAQKYHDGVYEQSRLAQEDAEALAENEEAEEDDDFMRAHPLTVAGRFKPAPSTVFLPKETLVDPTALLLTRANHKHLTESSNRIFGGRGLPFSASTVPARLGREQKPIPLDPSQADMGNIEADAYIASVQPGTYASVMSALVEVRRRLGTPWMERILQKKGGMILDAGSGGVGVLAWHEILQAEWQRMHEESGNTSHSTAPLGKATVLAGSDTLRHRASRLLENTTFIPRLPDSVAAEDENNEQQPRKVYDIVIAPHTLWSLRQEYLRKEQVEKYWSLLNPKGGVLILLEKGLPRGFEVVAAAREHLLNKHISSPHATAIEEPVDSQVSKPDEETRFTPKETGMIIAPCTNHAPCPMYASPGVSQGRKDFCFFSQRYIRPPYLQRILNAKDKNHEDVQFSYLAVQRGRDQRLPEHDLIGRGFEQTDKTTAAAFAGHEWKNITPSSTDADKIDADLQTPQDVNPLTLPRLILPALKRRGHIILDVCTPAGTLERWTVPRSFSKQAFRDARKARWGDLWALGAKTRIPRSVRLGKPQDEFDKKGRKMKKAKQVVIEIGVGEKDGRSVEEGPARILRGDRNGRYTSDRKIRGSGGRKGRKKSMDADVLDDL
ncbi:mitochondrial small ribosomal subunit Rsm22-domain-containing protein [Paraphoma chrysanthemicola]|uniref:Mitochondrial small ribosomal subunit Rsm22-domain-containing protein n=1 Tax=Paraphoma chrysanthemicola TaxID=798071 RepID=A0A8K0R0G5_9PLEO|nr:mitochondrial small ribosomal subunit Rsm22-domain-containing protein [Paraphoma chrysanthemicola]